MIKQFSSGVDVNPRLANEILYTEYLEVLKTNDHHGFLNIHTEKSYGQGRFEINLSKKYLDKWNGTTKQRQ